MDSTTSVAPKKRGPGRPRKNPEAAPKKTREKVSARSAPAGKRIDVLTVMIHVSIQIP